MVKHVLILMNVKPIILAMSMLIVPTHLEASLAHVGKAGLVMERPVDLRITALTLLLDKNLAHPMLSANQSSLVSNVLVMKDGLVMASLVMILMNV